MTILAECKNAPTVKCKLNVMYGRSGVPFSNTCLCLLQSCLPPGSICLEFMIYAHLIEPNTLCETETKYCDISQLETGCRCRNWYKRTLSDNTNLLSDSRLFSAKFTEKFLSLQFQEVNSFPKELEIVRSHRDLPKLIGSTINNSYVQTYGYERS